MRSLLLSFFVLLPFCFTSFSQEVPKEFDPASIRRYIHLEDVLKKEITLTKADSLAFRVVNGDTLVLVTPALEKYFPFGVQVRVKPQDSVFIEKYKEAVYGPENWNGRDRQSIKIWKDGIRLYFDASVPKKHQKELMKFSKRLTSEVDSLSIEKVSEREKANYVVFYRNSKNDYDLDPRIKNPEAGYYLNWEKNTYFTRGILKVNTFSYKDEQQILMDLKKRFFETLGYFRNFSEASCGSLLSACGEEKKLSEIDLEILKYHYSYQNCIGIDLEEFECQQEYRRKRFAEHPDALIYVSHLKD